MGRGPAKCHPSKKVHGRGLCQKCYNRWRRQSGKCTQCGEITVSKSLCSYHLANAKWDARLKRYGITRGELESLKSRQECRCAICGSQHQEGLLTALGVDHNHKTGKICGLLCRLCNLAVGNFRDDPELCEKAAVYLRRNADPS